MKFKNETERMRHPQAKLISIKLWRDFFNQTITDFQLALMESGEDLMPFLRNCNHRIFRYESKEAAFYSIIFSHEYLSDYELKHIATNILKIPIKNIILLATVIGREQLAINLLSNLQTKHMDVVRNIFYNAAENGRVAVLNESLSLASDNNAIENLITDHFYIGLRMAVENGHLIIFNRIVAVALENKICVKQMVSAHDYDIFRLASKNGHSDILNNLVIIAKNNEIKLRDIIKADNYLNFRCAAENGHMEILNTLLMLAGENNINIAEMISAGDCYAFRYAAGNGHLDVMKMLLAMASKNGISIEQMIGPTCSYSAFYLASVCGHLDALNMLVMTAKDINIELRGMIEEDNYCIIRQTAENGHMEILNTLLMLAGENNINIAEMISAGACYAFRCAAENGHLDVMNRIFRIARENGISIEQIITSDHVYSGFQLASANGDLEALNMLIAIATSYNIDIAKMVKAHDYYVFRSAAENGHVDVLNWLLTLASNTNISTSDMIAARDYYAFRYSILKRHMRIADQLLEYPNVFAYTELNANNHDLYADLTADFITHKIQLMCIDKNLPESVNSDLATLCFYMIKNMIRRNDDTFNKNIEVLLTFPAVIALMHLPVRPDTPNELVRLAASRGNRYAVIALLSIPAVMKLVIENDFYFGWPDQKINLKEIAIDVRKVRMTARLLSQGQGNYSIEQFSLFSKLPDEVLVHIAKHVKSTALTENEALKIADQSLGRPAFLPTP